MKLLSFPSPSRVGDTRLILITALIFISVLGFYFYTLQPSLAWGDGMKVQLETITGESFIQSVLPDDLFANDPFPFAKVGIAAWDHPLYVIDDLLGEGLDFLHGRNSSPIHVTLSVGLRGACHFAQTSQSLPGSILSGWSASEDGEFVHVIGMFLHALQPVLGGYLCRARPVRA